MQKVIKDKILDKWVRNAHDPYRNNQGTYRHPEPVPGMITAPSHLSTPKAAVQKLHRLINGGGSETEAHRLLLEYPSLLPFLMDGTGHHGTWYANKPQICPPLISGKKGKIPDFLLAGENSAGLHWFIVELKSPSDMLFDKTGEAFSTVANKGLNQLARYQKYSEKHQGALRDALGITDFATPRGILVIGNEKETLGHRDKQELKTFWNQTIVDIEIMSYSRLLRQAREAVTIRRAPNKFRKK